MIRCKSFKQHEHSIITITSMHLNLTDDEDRERGLQMDRIAAWGSRCPLEALEGLFTGACGSYCSARQPLQPDDWCWESRRRSSLIDAVANVGGFGEGAHTHTQTWTHRRTKAKVVAAEEQNTFEYWGWVMLAFNRSIIGHLCCAVGNGNSNVI